MNEPNLHDSHVKEFRKYENRRNFPGVVLIIDQLTKFFPEANKPEYVNENGKAMGNIKHTIGVCSIDGICYGRMK